jgi:membrane-associated phospholipid phosphatase
VPTAARRLTVAIVVVCAAVTAVLGAWLRHETSPGWVDAAVDARLVADLDRHPLLQAVLVWPGAPVLVTAMAAALVLACILRRRYGEAVFVAISVPVAAAITERLLKPLIGPTSWGSLSFPSGHVTGVVALATAVMVLLARAPARVPRALRLVLAFTAFLIAAGVASGVIGANMHHFTDTVGGAAVGTGTVLLTALILDVLSPKWRRPHDRLPLTAMPPGRDSLQPPRPDDGRDNSSPAAR